MRTLHVALALSLLAFAGCAERLHGALTEREANEILAALAAHGFEAEKLRESGRGAETFELRVARRELPRALAVLGELGLPREASPGLERLLGEGGLIPSELEEHAKLAAATQAELAETLRRIDGVLDARVHVALPRKAGPFEGAQPRPRASVFLKTRGEPSYDPASVRALVVGGVRDLSIEDVEVVSVVAAREPRAEAAPNVRVGPFEVAGSSALALRITLTLCVVSILLLSVALFSLMVRKKRTANA